MDGGLEGVRARFSCENENRTEYAVCFLWDECCESRGVFCAGLRVALARSHESHTRGDNEIGCIRLDAAQ